MVLLDYRDILVESSIHSTVEERFYESVMGASLKALSVLGHLYFDEIF